MTVDAQIIDKINARFDALKQAHLNVIESIKYLDTHVYSIFESINSSEDVEIILQPDFYLRTLNVSHSIDMQELDLACIDFINSLKVLDSPSHREVFLSMASWLYYSVLIFTTLKGRSERQNSVDGEIESITTINAVLQKIKSEFLTHLHKSKTINEKAHHQFLFAFTYNCTHKSVDLELIDEFVFTAKHLDIQSSNQYQPLLNLKEARFIRKNEWEVISEIFGNVSSFNNTLKQCEQISEVLKLPKGA